VSAPDLARQWFPEWFPYICDGNRFPLVPEVVPEWFPGRGTAGTAPVVPKVSLSHRGNRGTGNPSATGTGAPEQEEKKGGHLAPLSAPVLAPGSPAPRSSRPRDPAIPPVRFAFPIARASHEAGRALVCGAPRGRIEAAASDRDRTSTARLPSPALRREVVTASDKGDAPRGTCTPTQSRFSSRKALQSEQVSAANRAKPLVTRLDLAQGGAASPVALASSARRPATAVSAATARGQGRPSLARGALWPVSALPTCSRASSQDSGGLIIPADRNRRRIPGQASLGRTDPAGSGRVSWRAGSHFSPGEADHGR
jgi:hypothetical protein